MEKGDDGEGKKVVNRGETEGRDGKEMRSEAWRGQVTDKGGVP